MNCHVFLVAPSRRKPDVPKKGLAAFVAVMACLFLVAGAAGAEELHVIFTSDQHYGVTRKEFRGRKNADSGMVNAAMVNAINSLAGVTFPADCGVMAGKKIVGAEYIISGGDIANRMEGADAAAIMTATQCWDLYAKQYLGGLTLNNSRGEKAEILTFPGNHDLSNAIGFYKTMTPAIDKTSMLEMYKRAYGESILPEEFDARKHTIFLSRDMGGLRLFFVQMWPDSAMRERLAKEIDALPQGTPVILFTHIQPDIDAKRFVNPNGDHDVNAKDKFENLVADVCSVETVEEAPIKEQRELARFIKDHPSIIAYFHGHEHENIFSLWRGPDGDVALPTFMVDSPMKGKVSGEDEARISFHSIAIDTDAKKVTVRQVLWNANPADAAIAWGDSMTFVY